jgi:hypothetical protein
MSTQKGKLDRGSLDRNRAQKVRRGWGRAFAVAAAIGLVAVACTPGTRDGQRATAPANQPPTVYPADPKAEEVAMKFVEAFGAFDGERAITYLADNAYLQMDATTPEEVPVFTSFLEAQGYEQIPVEECSVTDSSALGTAVRCRFDWHAIRSDEIGLGPYPGYWDLTVRDGEIGSVSLHWEIERFSPEMWDPFRDWVSKNHPKDFAVMYVGGGTNFSLTEESIRLWERRSREYVKVRIARMVELGEVDYVIDLNTDERTPLPRAILRSLGPDGGRPFQSPGQYAASPDGSRLAYVGLGDVGSLQIFIADLDGTRVRQVTHDPTGAISPAWSPDGTRIAYQGYGSGDVGNIFLLDLATGESTRVTDEPPLYPGSSQFTPDGSSLIYTGAGAEYAVILMVPVEGGKSTLLFEMDAGNGRALGSAGEGSQSPDGSLVTFMGHEVGGPGAIRFVANADGTERRSVGSCISNPAGTWSPDGSRIVCGPNGPPRGIRVIDIATGDATRVAEGRVAIWLDDHTLLVEA